MALLAFSQYPSAESESPVPVVQSIAGFNSIRPKESLTGHVDMLIVGAGISGIGLGHYLVTKSPGKSYAIVDGRDAIGGTWDLFRYPGIRSDSDMHTFGFEYKPWTSDNAIADAHEILTTCTKPSPRTDWPSRSTCSTG